MHTTTYITNRDLLYSREFYSVFYSNLYRKKKSEKERIFVYV